MANLTKIMANKQPFYPNLVGKTVTLEANTTLYKSWALGQWVDANHGENKSPLNSNRTCQSSDTTNETVKRTTALIEGVLMVSDALFYLLYFTDNTALRDWSVFSWLIEASKVKIGGGN